MQQSSEMNKKALIILILLQFFLLSSSFSDSSAFKFPEDHGKHNSLGYEWWVFSGQLTDSEQHSFGFSLSFYRYGISEANSPSQWSTNDIYASYFTIIDLDNEQIYSDEKQNRTSFNFAGASDTQLLIWNREWKALMSGNEVSLIAKTKQARITLQLKAPNPPFLVWQNGYSDALKLHYYVMPALNGFGELEINDKSWNVSAISSMEHGFSAQKNNSIRWDKFTIHLNNNEDLYISTLSNGGWFYSDSFCAIHRADGQTISLNSSNCQLTPLDKWSSSVTKLAYPMGWTVSIPEYHYNLTIKPTSQNQETHTLNGVSWSGYSSVEGEESGTGVSGYAWIELSGKQ